MQARILCLILFASLFCVSNSAVAAEEVDQVIEVVGNPWNSLEVVRLITGLLIPAALLFVGVWMDRRIKEIEHRQWSNQKIIEKRLEVYEKITPQLNEMMCFFVRIGSWKEHAPTCIVDMKRELDKIAYIYAPLFSPKFLETYNDFMGLCFATERGAGKDAQLRTDCEHYREAYVGDESGNNAWQERWDDCFTGAEEASEKKEVHAGYNRLLKTIATEIGVGLEADADPKPKKSNEGIVLEIPDKMTVGSGTGIQIQ
ncbi:MAG: hypothetical protein AAFX06_03500 [Planctomycetota bacterium]